MSQSSDPPSADKGKAKTKDAQGAAPGASSPAPLELPAFDERRLSFSELKEYASLLDPEMLRPLFADGLATVRGNAATASAVIKNASPDVIRLLRDSDPRVARIAATSIDRMRVLFADHLREIVQRLEGTTDEVTDAVVETLTKLVGHADDSLLAAFDVSEATARKSVIAACERLGDAGIDLLLRGTREKNDRVRANCVVGLELLADKKRAPAVIERLEQLVTVDPIPDIRASSKQAITAILQRLPSEEVVDPLPKNIPDFEVRPLSVSELKEYAAGIEERQVAAALEDGRKHVRINGARLLSIAGSAGPAASDALALLLRDGVAQVRREAARAFAALGPSAIDAADALVAACGDDVEDVAEAAADALAGQGDKVHEALVRGLDAGDELHGRRIAKLVSQLANAADVLCTAFGSPAVNVQVNAVRGLALLGPKRIGARGLELVANARTGGDARTRAAVLEAMEIIDPPKAGPPPIRLKGFEDSYLSVKDLEQRAPTMRVDSLVVALSDGRPAVRANAATALRIIGGKAAETIPLLGARLRDDSASVRLAALHALGAMGTAMMEVAGGIVGALGDDDERVVQAARRLIGDIGARFIGPMIKGLDTDDRRHGENILLCINTFPDASEILCDAFASAAVNVQVNAAIGLGMLGPDRVDRGKRLLEEARTGGWVQTREAVFEALEMLAPQTSGPPPIEVAGFEDSLLAADAFDAGLLREDSLLAVSSDGRAVVRANAVTGLSVLGSTAPETVRLVGVLLRDSEKDVRVAAARAAGRLGEVAIQVAKDLVGALGDRDGEVVQAAASVLSAHGARVVGALLRGLETDDPDHGDHILAVLVGLADASEVLCDAFMSPSVNVQVNAARGLGMLGPRRVGSGRRALEGARTGGDVRTREAVFAALAMLDRG